MTDSEIATIMRALGRLEARVDTLVLRADQIEARAERVKDRRWQIIAASATAIGVLTTFASYLGSYLHHA